MKKKHVKIIDYGEFQNEYYPELVGRKGVVINEVVRYEVLFEDGSKHWVYARHTREIEE
jgi:hypothetical protein